jgi:hypothetical protein
VGSASRASHAATSWGEGISAGSAGQSCISASCRCRTAVGVVSTGGASVVSVTCGNYWAAELRLFSRVKARALVPSSAMAAVTDRADPTRPARTGRIAMMPAPAEAV